MVVVGKCEEGGVVIDVAAVLGSASSSVSASDFGGDASLEAAISAALAAEHRHHYGG